MMTPFPALKRERKKEETDHQTESFKLFSEKPEMDPKNEETDQKKRKPINKLRV